MVAAVVAVVFKSPAELCALIIDATSPHFSLFFWLHGDCFHELPPHGPISCNGYTLFPKH